MTFLDGFPFPWDDGRAQLLHRTLVDLYPSQRAAISIAREAGVDTNRIQHLESPFYMWQEVLDGAARGNVTRKLVDSVRDGLRDGSPERELLNNLLEKDPTRTAEKRSTIAIENDLITPGEKEALLYRDDLTLSIACTQKLIKTLETLSSIAPSVCRIRCIGETCENRGTAIRIGKNKLLTAWHVLHPEDKSARTIKANFGFDDEIKNDGALESDCNVGAIWGDMHDDWAVIETQSPIPDRWPIFNVMNACVPNAGDPAYVIQHPLGGAKRIGFVRNTITSCSEQVIQYLTDTHTGSSGAPVFDSEGRFIAIHLRGGTPQETLGGSPVRKNEGLSAGKVIEGLRAQGLMR